MKGMELAKLFYEEHGIPMIDKVAPEIANRIAVGLVGEGSQCFGFDDEISQDHDFAPGFCLWLGEEDMADYGQKLQQAYDALPTYFRGFSRENVIAADRLGVKSISAFYSQFTGTKGVPENLMGWLFTPETYLAVATNGMVFRDDEGSFSRIRQELLDFYPQDVLRKKLTARAAVMSQAGQYNLLRLIRRKDKVAAMLAAGRFAEAAMSMIYLLNRRYMPFYKWAYYGLKDLRLCWELGEHIEKLTECVRLISEERFEDGEKLAYQTTEAICAKVALELNRQGFSSVKSDFLQDHLQSIMDGVEDPQIRQLHFMVDCSN